MVNYFRDLKQKALDSTVYIQDGKRYINDDTQLDKTRPYQRVSSGGSEFVAPPVRDTSWDTPDAAERIQSPAPAQTPRTLEENTQRFKEIDRSIVVPTNPSQAVQTPPQSQPPAMPNRGADLPDFVSDDKVLERYDRSVKTMKPAVEQYFGNNFMPGGLIQEAFIAKLEDPNLSTAQRIEMANVLERSQPREIIHEFASAVWEQLDERQREIFIGAATIQVERFTPATRNRFDNLVSTEKGRAEMFASILDYVVSEGGQANQDIIDMYEQAGLLAKRPESLRIEVPVEQRDWSKIPFIGETINEFMKTAGGAIDEQQFNNAILGLTDGIARPQRRADNHVKAALAIKDIINESNTPSTYESATINTVKAGAPFDAAVSFLDMHEIAALRRSHPELAEMPIETFLQVLSVNVRDVGAGASSAGTGLTLQQRAVSGLLSDAEQQWFEMGLSDEAMAHLHKYISLGGARNISPELTKLATDTKRHFEEKQRLLDWLTAKGPYASLAEGRKNWSEEELKNGDWMRTVPRDLIKNFSASELYELGFPVEFIQEEKGDGSIPVLSGIFDAIGWVFDALESWHDKEAARTIGDPTDGFRVPRSVWERFNLTPSAMFTNESGDFLINERMQEQLRARDINVQVGDSLAMMYPPELRPGGYYDTKLAEIYNSPYTTKEERDMLEDIAMNLADPETAKLLVDMIESGVSVAEAADAVGTFKSLLMRNALGWDMMFIGLGGMVSKGANTGVRALFRIPEFVERAAPTLRGLRTGAFINLADDVEAFADMLVRKAQIEDMLEEGARVVRTAETGSSRGLLTNRVASYVDDTVMLTDSQVAKLTDELAEINRLLADPGADQVLRANILDPRVLPTRYSTGSSLSDIFQVYRPLKRALAPATGARFGDEALSGLINSGDDTRGFFSRIFSGDALRSREYAQRARVVANVYNLNDEVAQIFRKLPMGRVVEQSMIDDGQGVISYVRGVMDDLANAGRTDSTAAFVAKYNTHIYVTDNLFKTAEFIGNDLNLKTFRTLHNSSRIAANPEQYAAWVKEAIESVPKKLTGDARTEAIRKATGNIFRNEREFFAHFQNELNEAATEAMAKRYLGKSWDDVGTALTVQNAINGALSMFMLENPGFVIRNVISNMSAAALDGALPWKTFGRSPYYLEKYREQFGAIDPLAFSFSPKGLQHADVEFLESTLARELFGGGWKGGGVPFIGGLPFMRFRAASAHFEAVNRMRITQTEAGRFVSQMWKEDTFLKGLRQTDPEAAAVLDKLAASGAFSEEFMRNLFVAITDQSIYNPSDIVRFVSNITADGRQMALSVDMSPVRIAEQLGFHTPHLKPEAMAAMREIMSSYDPNLVDLATFINRSNTTARSNIVEVAAKYGVPADAVDDIIDIYDVLFHSAKQMGMSPKDASDFARGVSTGSSFRLRGIYERNRDLQQYLNDPEVYRNAVFPYANGITKSTEDVRGLVGIPTTPQITKREVLDLLTKEDEMLGWRAASDIIDAAKSLKEPLDGSELPLRIRRAVEGMSQLRQAQAQSRIPRNPTALGKAREAAIAQHKRDFNPSWPVERKHAYLKSQILKVAELRDPSLKISANPNSHMVRNYLAGARAPEVRRALNELIEEGTLARKYIEGSQQEGRYVLELVENVPTGKSVLNDAALKTTFAQYVEDITYLADQVAQARIAEAAPAIRQFNTNLNRSRKKTMEELREMLMREMQGGNTDPDSLVALANARLDAYANRTKERFNDIANKLEIKPAPIDADRESHQLGRYYAENAPSQFTQSVSDNVPTISFYRDIVQSDAFTEYGRDKFGALRTAIRSMGEENERVMGQPFFNTVMRDADPELFLTGKYGDADAVRRLTDASNEAARDWASKVDAYPEYTLPGWTRRLSSPTTFTQNAPVANIPEGLKVAPANIGMADDLSTPGVPPRGVWGRTFTQQPPEGYRAVITGDDWVAVGGVKDAYGLNRLALFVRNDTTEAEFLQAAKALMERHVSIKKNKGINSAIKASGREALEQNPSGFYAAYQIKSPTQVTQELKPFLKMANEGDEVAQQVINYARDQWRSGWPITGHPLRNLQNVYDNFAAAARKNIPFGNYYTPISVTEGKALIRGINSLVKDKNELLDIGIQLGKARADWILHNYNNTNDIDFLMRWLGPWHIWPTRTMGKLATRILDNPHFYLGYKAMEIALQQANQDLPDYMADTIPLDYAIQGLQMALGSSTIAQQFMGIGGANVNVQSLFFWNDLIGDFSTARAGSTGLGRFVDNVDDYIPLNPLIGWSMIFTGQFGEADRLEPLNQLTRPLEMTTQLIAEAANMVGLTVPSQVFLTSRDINNIELEFGTTLAQLILDYGSDSEEVSDFIDAFDEWGRMSKGGLRLPPLQYLGAAFGVGDMNKTIVQVMNNASRNTFVGIVTSYLAGHKVTLYEEDRQKFYDAMAGMREVLGKEYKTNAERKKAINDYMRQDNWTQALSVYLRNNDRSSDMNALSQSEALWFSGLEDINNEFDLAYSQLKSTGSNVTSEENAEMLTKLYLARTSKIAALAHKIEERVGINPQTDPHFSITYRVRDPEIVDLAERIELDIIAPRINPVGSFKGNDTRILENIDMLAGGEEKTALIEAVKDYAKRNNTRPEFVTVGQFNRDLITTEATALMLTMDNALKTNDLYIRKDGGFTNAMDIGLRNKARDEILSGWPESKRRLYEELAARSLSPEQAIDRAINQWVGDKYGEWTAARREGAVQGYSSTQLAYVLDQVEKNYKSPTVDDIRAIVEDITKGLWRNNNEITEDDFNRLIRERLSSAEKIGDLNTIMTGNYDDNIGSLAAGLARVAELKAMPQTKEVVEELRNLTGYEEDGKWKAGTLRHFTTPNGYVITTMEELNEFREGYRINKELAKMHEFGVHIKLDAKDFESWSKYFNRNHNDEYVKSSFLDYLADTNQWDKFDAAVGYFNRDNPNRPDNNIYNADGSIRRPDVGLPSAGMDLTRTGGKYRFEDLGTGVELSRNGLYTKTYLEKHFTGSKSDHIPPDYIFELLSRNGITEEGEITDFFWSLYEATEPLWGDIFEDVNDIAFTLFTYTQGDKDSKGRPQVSSYQYLLGIRAIYDTVFGYKNQQAFRSDSKGGSSSGGSGRSTTSRSTTAQRNAQNKKISRAVTLPKGWSPKSKAATTAPSNRGAGGMPEWKEAVSHMQAVFADSTLLADVIKYFNNNNHRMTNNHIRMLRAMYKTFPIGSASNFNEWLAALRLMYKTAEVVAVRQPTVINPGGYGDNNPPRLAKFRR